MPNLSRQDQIRETLVYHVYNRGIDRHYLFSEDADKEYFTEVLSRYSEKFGLEIYHWVIMSNHYHLLLKVEDPKQLSKVFSGVGVAYAYNYHNKYRTSFAFFNLLRLHYLRLQ